MASTLVRRMAAFAVVALLATPLAAQQDKADKLQSLTKAQIDKMSEAELRDLLTFAEVPLATSLTQPFFRGAPGTSSGSPAAFGAGWRDGFVGGGITSANGSSDGSMAFGFGLGNAKEAVGLEVVVSSLSSFRSGVFNRTAFSFKAHHMLGAASAVAIGVENAIVSDDDPTSGNTVYAVASHVIQYSGNGLVKSLTVSGGLGNGRIRFLKDQQKDNSTMNAFFSAGAQLHPQFSVLADWSGPDLAAGVSFVPFTKFPVIISPTFTNLTGQDGASAAFSLGFGIGMRF